VFQRLSGEIEGGLDGLPVSTATFCDTVGAVDTFTPSCTQGRGL